MPENQDQDKSQDVNIVQLLTDTKNQPHQYVGHPDKLADLLREYAVGEAEKEVAEIIKKAQDEASKIVKEAEKEAISGMSLEELNDAAEKVKAKELSEAEEAEKKVREELFEKYGYELMIDMIYLKKLIRAGTRNKLTKLKSKEIEKLLAKDYIRK